MEDKRLDFNAPLLSVRRFVSAPPPALPSPSPSSSAAAPSCRADADGGVGKPRRASLPFYKSDLKSGPVRNPGVVPFVWEQSPGRPKGGRSAAVDPPAVTPKLPPGRNPRRRSEEKEEHIRTGAINSASRSSLISSSRSTFTATTSTTTPSSATSSKSVETYTETSKRKTKTNPMVGPVSEAPISEEHHGSTDEDDEEEDAFSDALDTLSRTESCFMNCSVSGLSGGAEARVQPGGFSTDPQVRDFMMGRFLPAAQAVATRSPQYAPRKAAAAAAAQPRRVLEIGGERRRPASPLPYQHRAVHTSAYPRIGSHQTGGGKSAGGDDDDDDDDEGGHLSMKGCGFLPRFGLRSSFCLLNPVPGVKVRGRAPLPVRGIGSQLRASKQGSLGFAEDEHTWEEIFKYKLEQAHQPPGEEGNKLTTESNHLSYRSDSQTPDGSSPYRRSNAGGISPYRNEMPPSPFHEGKGVLAVPDYNDLVGENGHDWEKTPHQDCRQAFGSLSPAVEKTVYVDSVQMLESRSRGPCSSDANAMLNYMDKDYEIGRESQRTESSSTVRTCVGDALQHKSSELIVANELQSADKSDPVEQMDDSVGSMQNHVLDGLEPSKAIDGGKNDNNILQALLPPPLPKSPSESWLWRTLPSVSSKNSNQQSFLGFQFHPKKQGVRASSTDPSWETMIKTATLPKGQMRFADVLAMPAHMD